MACHGCLKFPARCRDCGRSTGVITITDKQVERMANITGCTLDTAGLNPAS